MQLPKDPSLPLHYHGFGFKQMKLRKNVTSSTLVTEYLLEILKWNVRIVTCSFWQVPEIIQED